MGRLHELLSRATLALGRLDAVAEHLPDTHLLLYFYVRKEAVLSSQIEGTQSSLSDLLLYETKEAPGVPIDDVQEVSSYVSALKHGLKRLREGFPLSLRLIREMHAILLSKGRGSHKQPGEFRTSQNWIGGSRPGNAKLVPPPPERLMECLDALEKYMHADNRPYPALIDAALIHVQFETIHPFLDGNGRIGRLLITFLLSLAGILKEPILYLSLFFKNNRDAYYERLDAVRSAGDWEGWLEFFLTGVAETADQVSATMKQSVSLFEKDEEAIKSLKRARINAAKAHEFLRARAMTTVPECAKALGVTAPTARAALNNLLRLKIVNEVSGRERGKIYVYKSLVDLLEQGTQPLAH
jgi:Fic family protein